MDGSFRPRGGFASPSLVSMGDLHPAMSGHLEAVTQDAERLRGLWSPEGVLEVPVVA